MSFILDALRKSEHARQRTTGPGFAEAPVAAPKPKTNVWATAAVALLVINLVAVGVLLTAALVGAFVLARRDRAA